MIRTSPLVSSHYLAPEDIATIYDLTPLYNRGNFGNGQTIAIMGQSDILMSDISAFRTMFNLSANPPKVLVGRIRESLRILQEADLDLEWAGAVARNANLIYVYPVNVFNALTHTVNQNLAPIISYSYRRLRTGDYSFRRPVTAARCTASQRARHHLGGGIRRFGASGM